MMVNGQIIAGMYPQNAIRALRYLRTALDFCDPWKPEYLDKVYKKTVRPWCLPWYRVQSYLLAHGSVLYRVSRNVSAQSKRRKSSEIR